MTDRQIGRYVRTSEMINFGHKSQDRRILVEHILKGEKIKNIPRLTNLTSSKVTSNILRLKEKFEVVTTVELMHELYVDFNYFLAEESKVLPTGSK